ncbi:PH domain-containing protein [Erythrobacter litoralis]|uniref:Photosynthetic complex assembly protein n=2 Tax=Erythrobacter litoralis TaxID=39960 RepID=A0A074MDF8_9SPHN|nr:photosynthetic complex putative assembly protein PuhB [Erythrobacter litoralis]AOL22838.1 PH domain-containing protein [Erythrobacter litoralis]KEO92861.1 photosynthetic complex assembly protein [Erythrobacter litoralis]MEE4338655.1 photosynthetic complex putative assembly protein PuhB [Erythrobacter sp.]
MDLKTKTMPAADPELHAKPRFDPPELENAGPTAHGDPMGTPAADEKILWKGRPDRSVLARTAFHTRSVAIYFAILVAVSVAMGNYQSAAIIAALCVAGLGVLNLLAWLSVRSTLYILTDTRLIMRIGMAIETRINVPLKQISAANLKMRGKDHGDIAVELKGERLLGYLLMWPHVRPFRLSRPEPMLRGIAEPEKVARMLADACAEHISIERNLTEIKEAATPGARQVNGPAAHAKSGAPLSETKELSDNGLEGAPA